MTSKSAPIDDVFLNVRKAYRLLHDYQRMVIDAVTYIGAQIDIEEAAGRAKFSDDARAGYRYLWQPSWSWLPMICWEFHFVKAVQGGWTSLSLLIISDTGFIEGDLEERDPSKISAFAPADESSTKFAFILWPTHWTPLPFMDDKVQMGEFIKEGGRLPEALASKGYVGKCYDLSWLTTERRADAVVQDIITIAKANKLSISRKRTAIPD